MVCCRLLANAAADAAFDGGPTVVAASFVVEGSSANWNLLANAATLNLQYPVKLCEGGQKGLDTVSLNRGVQLFGSILAIMHSSCQPIGTMLE